MQFFDTHCHIHFPDYQLDPEEVRAAAAKDGVTRLLCVGCTLADSKLAVRYAAERDGLWASIGLHPHEAKVYVNDPKALQQFRELADKPKVVAVGETGLDYYYQHSSREDQQKMLRFQLDLAVEHDLPLIFHVRDAFDDFWHVFDDYKNLRGVVHSFTATQKELSQALERGLYVGLNGIMTFTKQAEQLAAAKAVPLNRLLLETDAPFLTPHPFRGKICEPRHVKVTAVFLAELRGENLKELAVATTQNARDLFNI
ncbi:MAG TPA: TatD family hydrolase [Candidatus Limnocylindria bacterium]|nr:TatD family hydrolase [Candidatus Limnocylindria bacterium]